LDQFCDCYLAYGGCIACMSDPEACGFTQDRINENILECYERGCSECSDFWTCGTSNNETGCSKEDSDLMTNCNNVFIDCSNNATSNDERCECYSTWGACIICLSNPQICNYTEIIADSEKDCNELGCTGCSEWT
jgi:hypothetical protein